MTPHRLLLATLMLAAAVPAWTQEIDPCRTEARAEFRTCKRDCRDAFREAKDTCSKRDHACVDACRLERSTCRAPFEAEVAAAVAQCDAALHDAKGRCRDQFADGTAELDACIDQAQGVAFACRDAAREAVQGDLRRCRRAYRGCVSDTCPPETPVDPAAFRACKLDAKDLMLRCVAGCREEFQLAKDTCLDRDHACVEACRAERTDCRAPILAVLDAALDVCATDRQAAIDTCRTLYAADTPERDACIDQAQLAAFVCRDTAREEARPGLRACREAFVDCAEACPPPGSPSGAFVE
jgi:hypothetical protein